MSIRERNFWLCSLPVPHVRSALPHLTSPYKGEETEGRCFPDHIMIVILSRRRRISRSNTEREEKQTLRVAQGDK